MKKIINWILGRYRAGGVVKPEVDLPESAKPPLTSEFLKLRTTAGSADVIIRNNTSCTVFVFPNKGGIEIVVNQ